MWKNPDLLGLGRDLYSIRLQHLLRRYLDPGPAAHGEAGEAPVPVDNADGVTPEARALTRHNGLQVPPG